MKLPAVTKAITPSGRRHGRSAKVAQPSETVVKQENVAVSEQPEIRDKKCVVDIKTFLDLQLDSSYKQLHEVRSLYLEML